MPQQHTRTELEYIMLLPQALHTRSQANHLRLYLIHERDFPQEIFTSSIIMSCGTPCWVIAWALPTQQAGQAEQAHPTQETPSYA